MDVGPIIKTILEATGPLSIFASLSSVDKDYKWLAKLLHPDVCRHKDAAKALSIVSDFRHGLKMGFQHIDEAGTVVYNQDNILFKGDPLVLKRSFLYYATFAKMNTPDSKLFKEYLPTDCDIDGVHLRYSTPKRAIPVAHLGKLEAKHVYWIISRMFELASWFIQEGFVHAGFNPDTIYVRPEDHGIICPTFYHMARTGSVLTSISGKYQHFYPPYLFTDKKAVDGLDAALIKKIGIYLLGDKSGVGNKIRKDYGPWIIEFLQSFSKTTRGEYTRFRKLLEEHTDTTKFHELKV